MKINKQMQTAYQYIDYYYHIFRGIRNLADCCLCSLLHAKLHYMYKV